MGSTRLPGKMLMEMAGRSMLWHNVERLRRARKVDVLVVAVPEGEVDGPLINHCLQEGLQVYRGSEEDVLGRYYFCAKEHEFSHVVRATGDCPLLDPEVVDDMIEMHLREGADYSSSKNEVGCGVPNGIGLEMFSFSALERSHLEGVAPNHREHINEYVLENAAFFRIAAYREPASKHCPELDLTVDTLEDYHFVKNIIEDFDGEHDRLTTEAIIAHWSKVQACS
jgi:spore coat polysaccharide biosynthesis protein SpsF